MNKRYLARQGRSLGIGPLIRVSLTEIQPLGVRGQSLLQTHNGARTGPTKEGRNRPKSPLIVSKHVVGGSL